MWLRFSVHVQMYFLINLNRNMLILKIMAFKPGPKRIADSTGKPDRRQMDNKSTPGNTPSLKPPVPKKK